MEKDENKQAAINIIYQFPNFFIYLLAGFVCHRKMERLLSLFPVYVNRYILMSNFPC